MTHVLSNAKFLDPFTLSPHLVELLKLKENTLIPEKKKFN